MIAEKKASSPMGDTTTQSPEVSCLLALNYFWAKQGTSIFDCQEINNVGKQKDVPTDALSHQ